MMPTMAERIVQVLLSDHLQVLNETSKKQNNKFGDIINTDRNIDMHSCH